jgi:SAM-dependent methyltransferase
MTGRTRDETATAPVAGHYDRWPFPGVDHTSREGLVLLRRLMRWLEAQAGSAPPRVIDVGCGTGHTTVALARRLPGVEFVGVDVASAALQQAHAHAEAAGVTDVRFEQADIGGPLDWLGTFEVVLALGVLHHVPDLRTAFARVASLVAEGGHLVLWMYGRHGRAAHMLNQRFLELLTKPGEGSGDREVVARAFLEELGDRFAADSGFYTPRGTGAEGVRWLIDHPAWLADQMFPAYERPVDLEEILALFDAHDLTFDHWFGVPEEPARWTRDPLLQSRLAALPRRTRLVALECLLRPAYYFVSGCRVGPDG